jgi:hypothetical protein
MANNINCTCGHSWSKASSSKKDMYVCHICGKDNTMEDGGWLSKFEQGGMNLEQKGDNYGKKPNPNDVQASVGPGFVGLGYDITGRNYSPAWGGQFEDGGYVAQKGKSVPTMTDSLALYNNANKVLNYYKDKKYQSLPSGEKYKKKNYYKEKNKEALEDFIRRNKMNAILLSRGKGSEMTSIPIDSYYKRFDDNRYFQREGASAILDMRSPMQLFDDRITPTMLNFYRNIDKNDPLNDDYVSIFSYDPILVKPVSMLTPEEKATRLKRYGKESGLIDKKTSTEKSKTEPVKQSSKKEPVIVNDPKDPKLKAYQDSLNLYNKNKKIYESGILQKSKGLKYESAIKGKPYGEKWYLEEGPSFNIIKKPVQPVEYKKLEEIKPTQPTPKGSKKYIVNGIEVSEEDFLGSGATTGGGKRIIYNTPNKGTQKVLRLDGTPETDPDKIRRALATANKDKMAMGGSMPGAVGFTYARVAGSAPSNGKYAKKTKASAQNGKEMKFYQEGLDFKPNSIAQDGEAIVDPMGQWAHPGEVTIIPGTDITMEGVDYPVLGISDTGDQQMMYPGEDYNFDGEYVTEYPMMKNGGWLDKYK